MRTGRLFWYSHRWYTELLKPTITLRLHLMVTVSPYFTLVGFTVTVRSSTKVRFTSVIFPKLFCALVT